MDRHAHYGLVAIAASAGGVHAVRALLSALPANLPVPVVLALDSSAVEPELLSLILARVSSLPVRLVQPGLAVRPGTVYVAPRDTHLVLGPERRFEFMHGGRIRQVLPSANPLFASAAEVLGPVVAVVLTGMGQEGTDGVQAVKAAGGAVIAQDPATARCLPLPRSAIASGAVDYVLPLDRIGPALVELLDRGPTLSPAPS